MVKKEVTAEPNTIVSTDYTCDACGFTTRELNKFLDHEKEIDHGLYSGSYPCKMCGKQCYVQPEDPSATDVEVDDARKIKGIKFEELKKEKAKIMVAQVRGGFGVCNNCKNKLKEALG